MIIITMSNLCANDNNDYLVATTVLREWWAGGR